MKTNNRLRFTLFLVGILITTHLLNAQSKDQNYIISRTFKNSICIQTNIQYYDGLGRPSELLQLNASPEHKHIILLDEYDGLGRETKKWLPYLTIPTDSNYVPVISIKNSISTIYGNEKPYSLNEYEPSPLSRLSMQYGPGSEWQYRMKGIGYEYLTSQSANNTYSCKYYKIENFSNDTIMHLSCDSVNCKSMFNIAIRKGEDNDKILNFTNGRGQNILTRQVNKDVFYDTYYIYDDYGNLRVVLPPVVSDSLNTATNEPEIVNNILSKHAYLYQFDARNRCIAKKLPGCQWTYYVYDQTDRLIFTQDGVQRSRGEWAFTIPDAEGRVCLKGICRNHLQIWDNPLKNIMVTVLKDAVGQQDPSSLQGSGYSISGISLSSPVLQEADYYDDYSLLDTPLLSSHKASLLGEENVAGFASLSSSTPRGLPTGAVYMHLRDDTTVFYNCVVKYYDSLERVVQTKSVNHLGGYDMSYLSYNLVGELLAEKRVHQPGNDAKILTERITHTYDLMGRLLTTSCQLNNSTPILLADNEYDELGRLQRDNRNGHPSLQTEYSYNIRSWLSELSGPLFHEKLHYTNGIGTPCYNGNISSMTWQCGTGQPERGYKFKYDTFNRLTNALYGEGGNITENADRYNEQVTGYDKMGNILGLRRYGQTSATGYGLIDKLSVTLDGNRLKAVNDSSTVSVYGGGFEFKDGANQTVEYLYDANGNLTKDLNKKIASIQYNCLNLPDRIEFEDGSSISYLYDAAGTKLRVVHRIAGNTTTTDYCGNVIYENGTPKTLLTEAGFVSLSDSKYHYYLQDHQGNNRVIASQDGAVEEVNHYYPFGGTFASTSSVQDYKYNGKELDRKGGLDWYDYGARHYDAALGRWQVVDPMAEKYYGISPYNYCLNNPIKFIDPNGMWPGDPLLQPFGRYPYGSNAGLNTLKFIHNAVTSAVNTPIDMINGLADETQYIYNNGVGSYLSAGANNIGNVVSSELSYRTSTPISQQAADTWQAMKDPQNWENATATAALMFTPMKKASSVMGRGASVVSTGTEATTVVKVHGNSLKSQRPTWGYKLYSTDGTFLKNGITSQIVPEKRYTKAFMEDKKMVDPILFPHRQAAWDWEYQQNLIQRGPLNKNKH